MRRLWFVVLALVAACAARADMVTTPGGRVEGKVAFTAEGLQVAGKPVAWGDTLFVIRDQQGRSIRSPEALRMASGEVWFAHVAGLSAGRLKARIPLLGERELDAAAIGAVDFLPDLSPPEPGDKPGTLYREKGEPVPGQLLWIDGQRLAIDSPLGVLTLSRDGLARYLFKAGASPAAAADEVSLLDGSTLRGQAKPVKDGLELDHAVLGKVAIPGRMVRSVLRHPAGVAWLGELAPARVNAVPLVVKGAPPETLDYPTLGGTRVWPGELLAIRGIRIQPKCTVTYRLPKLPGQRLVFAATVGPVEGMRGDVRLRLTAAGKTLVERDLGPAAQREAVTAEVPRNAELAVEVDFGPNLRFPCGVILGDPMVVGR
ncbi:MAG TPA: hypothetical protein VNE39_02930 [Planctomycetota bacterium]|nr:hypothetical protein [Planctomycetota bacterium]